MKDMLGNKNMVTGSALIRKLGLDENEAYRCIRKGECSNCLCDDVRYTRCRYIISWNTFARDYPSLTALIIKGFLGDEDSESREFIEEKECKR